jgi:hypothetical protein
MKKATRGFLECILEHFLHDNSFTENVEKRSGEEVFAS